jgi:hypothetical protein
MVAVVVSLPSRPELTADEQVSLRHVQHHLAAHDRFVLAPEGAEVDYPGFGVKRFAARFFGSARAHTDLLLTPQFYEAFRDYRFILIYHLDALVFSDDLLAWCARDWDYIGSPWVKFPYGIELRHWNPLCRVGNGGFSLRKVDSCIRVLRSTRPHMSADEYWRYYSAGKSPVVRTLTYWRRWVKRLRRYNSVRWLLQRSPMNEDLFWSQEAIRFDPGFRIAPFDEALRFSWETEPAECARLTGLTLPFGCHAWPRYDRKFWIPYLLDDARDAETEAGSGLTAQHGGA